MAGLVRLSSVVLLSVGWALVGCGQSGSNSGAAATNGGQGPLGGGGSSSVGGNDASSGSGNTTAGNAGSSAAGEPVLALPIEVLGSGAPDDPTIADAQLGLPSAALATTQQLYVQCHRCGFYDSPAFEALSKPLTKVKASLRVLGGATDAPWIDITDANVKVDDVSAAHGGVNGALVSIGFHVTLDAASKARLVALPANNKIEFRFNGTDGNSNGFRVLDVQFQDAAGANSSPMTKQWADISAEKEAGKAASDDATQGQALWYGLNTLIESPLVPRKIRASCSSCHASDARDLQYFNYSNHSIVERSRFHGLSEAQGKQIAAFIRYSLHDRVPHVAAAAPWNPPYQPGPGLDAKPIVEWAAGAGLAAVLPDGKAFLKAFTGKPVDDQPLNVSQADINQVMDATKVLNTREMALPLQFPDWNSWLPPVHPLDIWTPDAGQTQGLFETKNDNNNPLKVLAAIEDWLAKNKNPNGVYGDWSHLTADQHGQIAGMLTNFGGATLAFGGGGRGSRISTDPANPFSVEIGGAKLQALANAATLAQFPPDSFAKEGFIERANFGLYHWMGVKQWEIVHTYGVEGQLDFHGSKDASGKWVGQGEKRGWPFGWPSMFYVAPHMLYVEQQTAQGKREFYFSWEPRLQSYYRTNQWYQLQVSVNPGWAGASNGAIDWPYHMGFTTAVVDDLITAKAPGWVGAAHLARYMQIRTKLAQLANTEIPFDSPDPKDPQNLFANQGIQSKADLLFKLAPTTIMDNGPAGNEQTRFRLLEQIAPGIHLLFVNGTIALYNSLYANTDPAKYRRCDPSNTSFGQPEQQSGFRYCVDAARMPFEMNDQGKPHLPGSWDNWTTMQYVAWGAYEGGLMGADPALVKTYQDWVDRVWPK